MHREQPAGVAAPRGRPSPPVGPLPRSPQAGLGPGEDGWIQRGARGGPPNCEDSFPQPWDNL